MKILVVVLGTLLATSFAFAKPPQLKLNLGICNYERTEFYEEFSVTVYADGKLVADNFTTTKRNKLKLLGSHYYTIVIKKEGFQDYYLCYDARDTTEKDKTRLDFTTSLFPILSECAQDQVIEFHTKSDMTPLSPDIVKSFISTN